MNTIAETKNESIPIIMKRKNSGGKKIEFQDFDYYNAEMRFTEWLVTYNKILLSREGNPKNIIFTAHVMETEQPNIMTGQIKKTRSIVTAGKKISAWIQTPFDEVYMFGHNFTGGTSASDPTKTERLVFTSPEGEDDAKTAYRLAPNINFTDNSFYDLLQAQINGQKFMSSL